MFQYPISSPQMMRMFGLSVLGISYSCCSINSDDLTHDNANARDSFDRCFMSQRLPSLERPNMENHARDRRDPYGEKDDRCNQRQRRRKDALGVDESLLSHRFSHVAKAHHELDMVDDAEDQHCDPQHDEGKAEVAGRRGARDDVLLTQSLEKLEDSEAEADERERRADDRHQRAI